MRCGQQAAVFVLNRKSLILDGIDLIVDVRELSRTQTALFLCTGANLTLRNCSITILNHTAGTPLSLDPHRGGGTRPTHVRLERCLVRGGPHGRLPAERRSVRGGAAGYVFVAGRGGPLVRFDGADAHLECRIFLVQSLVAGPGPIIESTAKSAGGPSKPLVIRAFGSVFGRLHGVGHRQRDRFERYESTCRASRLTGPATANLFAGWKGFFACGDDRTVTVSDLAAARSTWNGTDLIEPGDPRAVGASRRPGGCNAGRLFVVRSQPSRHLGASGAAPRRPLRKGRGRLQRSGGAGAGGMDVPGRRGALKIKAGP